MNAKKIVLNKYKQNSYLYSYIFIVCCILLFVIAAFRPVGVDRDSINYANAIQSFIITQNINDVLRFEPSFYLIVNVSKFLFDDVVRGVLIIYALFGVSLISYAIKKYSSFPLLSLIVFSSIYFILHEMTQIRVGIAAAIFLLAIPDILNRNLKSFLIKTAFATLFHYSAIIMFFFYFINPKHSTKLFYILLPFIGILLVNINAGNLFLIQVISLVPEFLSYKINYYLKVNEMNIHNEINIFNIFYSSLLLIYLFIIININKLNDDFDVLNIKIVGWMFFMFYFFSFLPVFAFRIAEFIGIVLIFVLPSLISIIRQKSLIYFLVILYSISMLFNYIFIQKIINFGG